MRTITYSKNEMLRLWRLRHNLEDLRTDCEITRYDGIDTSVVDTLQLDAWYYETIATAPTSILPQHNIAGEVEVATMPDGSAQITLPERCLRVCSVRMQGWDCDGRIVDSYDAIARAQHSRYARGKSHRPVVVVENRKLRLYMPPSPSHPEVTELMVVMQPALGQYEVTEAMLAFN